MFVLIVLNKIFVSDLYHYVFFFFFFFFFVFKDLFNFVCKTSVICCFQMY